MRTRGSGTGPAETAAATAVAATAAGSVGGDRNCRLAGTSAATCGLRRRWW